MKKGMWEMKGVIRESWRVRTKEMCRGVVKSKKDK
jgi:hypothetical protein